MRVAGLAFTLFFAAFLLHWIVWRIKLPRRQSAALLLIYLTALPIGLAAVTLVPALSIFGPLTVWEIVQVSTFHIGFSLAYVVAYSAIEGRSPSMTLLSYVAVSRGHGRTHAELQNLLRDENPVAARLEAMVRDGMVVPAGDEFVLTAKGWTWARCFDSFRNLLQMNKGG